jgi:hypothetical protein
VGGTFQSEPDKVYSISIIFISEDGQERYGEQ